MRRPIFGDLSLNGYTVADVAAWSQVDVVTFMANEMNARGYRPDIAKRANEARAAVAELIDADREYDIRRTDLDMAKHARGGWAVNPMPHTHPAVIAFTAAARRRAAAIANLRGA